MSKTFEATNQVFTAAPPHHSHTGYLDPPGSSSFISFRYNKLQPELVNSYLDIQKKRKQTKAQARISMSTRECELPLLAIKVDGGVANQPVDSCRLTREGLLTFIGGKNCLYLGHINLHLAHNFPNSAPAVVRVESQFTVTVEGKFKIVRYQSPSDRLPKSSKVTLIFGCEDAANRFSQTVKSVLDYHGNYSSSDSGEGSPGISPAAAVQIANAPQAQEDEAQGGIRKGNIIQGMEAAGNVISADDGKAMEIDRQKMLVVYSDAEEARKRAMGNPEIQAILRDPAMRIILEQMQNDPKALQEHLKNPEVSEKIQKLIDSGIIEIRLL